VNISADTREELEQAIEAHEADGWHVVKSERHTDGSYTATLAREEKRKGDWITTFTGKQFYPLDPRADDICIEDIARSLAMKCRYGGHVMEFYSVAEHCYFLSHVVAPQNALWALMHDASEAYLGDIQRPLKPMLVGYRAMESNVSRVIAEKFGLVGIIPDEVIRFDDQIIADEARAICKDHSWTQGIEQMGVEIDCWPWDVAEKMFLTRFKELTHK